MLTVAIVLQFILAVFLTIAVMLQKSSSIGLGAYSGSNESLFGAKGPAGFLAKITFALGTAFILNTIFLTYSFNADRHKSVVDTLHKSVPSAPVSSAPVIPQAPVVPAAPAK